MKSVTGRYINPFGQGRRRASSAASYLQLPNHEPRTQTNGASKPNGGAVTPPPPYSPPLKRKRTYEYAQSAITARTPSWSSRRTRIVAYIIALVLTIGLFVGAGKGIHAWRHRHDRHNEDQKPVLWDPETDPRPFGEDDPNLYPWLNYPRLMGYFNGVRTLVPYSNWKPEKEQEDMFDTSSTPAEGPVSPTTRLVPMPLQRLNPYPDYDSKAYLADYHPVEPCFLDENNTRHAPDIFNYPGIPQHLTAPMFGSYEELGLPHDVCFDRFGRFGPYGYGYKESEGGLGIGLNTENEGSDALWERQGRIDYRGVNWGDAQRRCYEKNIDRFREPTHKTSSTIARIWSGSEKKRVARSAYVLRAWTGFKYSPHETMYLRAMINELSLKSGGEYDVHLLLHVRDDSIPIWTDKEVYQKVIEESIPEEFWGLTTLWSENLMRLYYPGPFSEVFENPSEADSHGVYRAQHLALQWFGHQHPEYDFVWNWEMDIRYGGNLYEFHETVAKWAKKQPRKGLWERSSKFWIPSKHGNYSEFTQQVEEEIIESGQVPVWGPESFPNRGRVEPPENTTPPHGWLEDDYEWGVGEEADLITFNPIFNPSETNWVFRRDITGYSLDLPIPPRRCAIVTVARLSRRLLDLMHEETYRLKHTAFPEMWPPTVALHHGLKAAYVPHPVYFDRQWPIDELDQKYNYPKTPVHSVFGYGEHNQLGNTFYFNSYFSAKLWRRWLGEVEEKNGGVEFEEENTGRMCLRPVLHHPVKRENHPVALAPGEEIEEPIMDGLKAG